MKIHLVVLSLILVGVVNVHGTCGGGGSSLCPPPFPDFGSIFRETLNLVPGIKTSLENMTAAATDGNCPMAVNWTEFNSQLNNGTPVPLDPVCRPSSTIAPKVSSLPAAQTGNPTSSTIQSGSEGPITPVDAASMTGLSERSVTIIIAVVVTGGVLVLASLIVVICVAVRCRNNQKANLLDRVISTNSQGPLVTEESFQPITPGTPYPTQNPLGAYNEAFSNDNDYIIKLGDTGFQESSTDATLPRTKDLGYDKLEQIVASLNDNRSPEETKPGHRGSMAFVTEEEEQEDAGYAGSEVDQEIWQNEINKLFDEAKLESNENLGGIRPNIKLPKKDLQQDETASGSSQFVVPTSSDRPRGLFGSPSSRRNKFSLPIVSTPSASQVVEMSPTESNGSPFVVPSSAKPLVTPQNSSSRHPLSQAIESGRNSTKVAKTKVRFESDSGEAPPAYSSKNFPSDDQGEIHVEVPIDVPNELPSYSEAVFAIETHEPPSNNPQLFTTSSSSSKVQKQPPQTKFKSKGSIDSQNSQDGSSNMKFANTAVIRPIVPSTNTSDADTAQQQSSMYPAGSSANGTNPNGEALNSTDNFSNRPVTAVRSLLSQFEAIANKKVE